MLTVTIANIRKTRKTTIDTFAIDSPDCSRATTIVFIEELCDMTRKGLRIRSSLRIRITGRFKLVRDASINDVNTIKKSS